MAENQQINSKGCPVAGSPVRENATVPGKGLGEALGSSNRRAAGPALDGLASDQLHVAALRSIISAPNR